MARSERGWWPHVTTAVRLRLLAIADRRMEAKYGLDTRRAVGLETLGVASANKASGFAYVAAPARIVEHLLDSLPGHPADTTFVDFGSGKGRVLLLASRRGFREVIGVEFSPELHEIACRNIARFTEAGGTSSPIRAVHADASDFPIPQGDCVLHFNNPFNEQIMARVLANLERSLADAPRRVWILYQQLRADLEDDATNNLDLLVTAPFLREGQLRPRSFSERILFGCHTLRIFESKTGCSAATEYSQDFNSCNALTKLDQPVVVAECH